MNISLNPYLSVKSSLSEGMAIQVGSMSKVPSSVLIYNMTFLPFIDLITFESTCKGNLKITQRAWKELGQKDRYNFTWQACEKETDLKQKWNYCLTKALITFAKQMQLSETHATTLATDTSPLFANTMALYERMEIYQKFERLWNKFSSLGDYCMQRHIETIKASMIPLSKLRESQSKILESSAKYGGEGLLYALHEIRAIKYNQTSVVDFPKIFQCFKVAIQNGATLSATIALDPVIGLYHFSVQPQYQKYQKFAFDLAIEAMNKGDWHPLENQSYQFNDAVLLDAFLLKYKDSGYPKVLAGLASKLFYNKDYVQADNLYSKALAAYGNNPPAYVLSGAAQVKARLNQLTEADALFKRALDASGTKSSPFLLSEAAQVKARLNQLTEADALYTRALAHAAYKDGPPANVLYFAARVKDRLNQLVEADDLFTRALAVYERLLTTYGAKNPPADVLYFAARGKAKLTQFAEANDLFIRALAAYGVNPPAYVLSDAAKVKAKLNQLAEVDKKSLNIATG